MKAENKTYSILWFNSNLRIDEDNQKCKLLNCIRNKAEQTYPISIQACNTVYDFVEFTIVDKWDVLLIDHKADGKRVISQIMKKIKDVSKNQDALRYCLSTDLPEDNEENLLEVYNFSENPITKKRYFQINTVEQSLDVFRNIVKELNYDGQLFVRYPEVKAVYDSVSSPDGRKAIKKLLVWNNNKDRAISFENGIRFALKDIYDKLEGIGFFKNIQSSRPPSFAKYIDGAVCVQKDSRTVWVYYLNPYCRSGWESTAMSFLDSFAQASHHDDTFKKPKEETEEFGVYNDVYRRMVFNAFLVFSRWYDGFLQKYHENNDDITVFFNDIKGVSAESTPSNQEQSSASEVYEGVIERNKKDEYWGVKFDYKGKSIFISLDDKESQSWGGGECVSFSLKEFDPVKKPNRFVAIKVRINPVIFNHTK